MRSKLVLYLIVLFCIIIKCLVSVFGFIHLDSHVDDNRVTLSVPHLIKSNGYPSEIHTVTTEDGYILEMHRIPHGKTPEEDEPFCTNSSRPIAFMVHCIFCTSSIWVMQGPHNGLGYMLADHGFDVWMLNTRGTSYSKRHVKHSSKSKQFWEFSLHEQAIYDVPAGIDYTLKYTNQTKINYIGYSMGTTLFFALMSYKPKYNEKIIKMIALAPAVYLNHSKGLILDVSVYEHQIEEYFYNINKLEVPPKYWKLKNLFQHICDYRHLLLRFSCAKYMQFMAGLSNRNLDMVNLRYYFSYFPDTTSVRTVIHFFQIRNSNEFRPFNYGEKKNLEVYDSLDPPLYNLSRVTAPVHIFESEDDYITSAVDISHLLSKLPNVVLDYKISVPEFTHADFGWGTNVSLIVYEQVLKALKGHE